MYIKHKSLGTTQAQLQTELDEIKAPIPVDLEFDSMENKRVDEDKLLKVLAELLGGVP